MSVSRFIGQRAAAVICAAGLLAGACTADETDGPPPPIDGLTAGGGGELNADERRFLFLAEQELVSRCMATEGFRYEVVAPPLADFQAEAPPPGVDLDNRRLVGYGYLAGLPAGGGAHRDAGPQDPNAIYAQSLPPERQQGFQTALFGRDDQPVIAELPDGDTVSVNAGGCLSEVRIVLYGDLETWLYLDYVTNNLRAEAATRMLADDRHRAAVDRWRSCMQARGFDYQTPGDARDAVADMYVAAGADRQAVLAQEIQIAVADGECDLETGLSDMVDRLRQAHLAQVEQDRFGEILGFQELQREALDRAEDLLR
jgi:hypothetical protein